jgi:hypothetical protein
LYNVLVNSYSLSDDQLLEDLENIRDYLRAESNRNEIHNANILFGGMAALSVLGTAALIAAYLNDRKNKTDETVNIKNNGV